MSLTSAALTVTPILISVAQAISIPSQNDVLLGRSTEQYLAHRHEPMLAPAGSLHRRSNLNDLDSSSWPDRLTRRAGGSPRRRGSGTAGDTPHASHSTGRPSDSLASRSGQPRELRDPSTNTHDRRAGKVPASLQNAPTLSGMRHLAASYQSGKVPTSLKNAPTLAGMRSLGASFSMPLTMKQATEPVPLRSSPNGPGKRPAPRDPPLNRHERQIGKVPIGLKNAPALPGLRQLAASLPSSFPLTLKQAAAPISDHALRKEQASSSPIVQLKRKSRDQTGHEAESSSSKRGPGAGQPATQTRSQLFGGASASALGIAGGSSSHPQHPFQPFGQSHSTQRSAGASSGGRSAKSPPRSPAPATEEWLSWLNDHGGSPSHT